MKKKGGLVLILCFIMAVVFYRVNPLISMLFFLAFLGMAFFSGKLG